MLRTRENFLNLTHMVFTTSIVVTLCYCNVKFLSREFYSNII